LDSIIGKTGIERQYDNLLRGIQGESVKIVNSVGKPLRDIPEKNLPAVPGKNVVLSIDSNLQDFAYHMLYKRRGAIIVTRPLNGEVIAFVSSPG
jgi:penicillin-binding protein 2